MPIETKQSPAGCVAPDARPLAATGPFYVGPGRAVVDSLGRVIARCEARAQLDAEGRVTECGLSPSQADGNAHALSRLLNAATAEPPRSLAAFMASIVQFARNNYGGGTLPPEIAEAIGYVCACFAAQYTRDGADGVETQEALTALKIEEKTSDELRLRLAHSFVSSLGGEKSKAAAPASSRYAVGDGLPLSSDYLVPTDDKTARFVLLLDSQDLKEWGDAVTGALVDAKDGEYKEVWITESSRPFSLAAIYTLAHKAGA